MLLQQQSNAPHKHYIQKKTSYNLGLLTPTIQDGHYSLLFQLVSFSRIKVFVAYMQNVLLHTSNLLHRIVHYSWKHHTIGLGSTMDLTASISFRWK
jgi:hypothetical protein